ncbi:hypothetical protein D3C87_1528960 [compost metagenome]
MSAETYNRYFGQTALVGFHSDIQVYPVPNRYRLFFITYVREFQRIRGFNFDTILTSIIGDSATLLAFYLYTYTWYGYSQFIFYRTRYF